VLVEATSLPLWGRIVAALAPVPLFVLWAAAFTRSVREEADELERRIQLEALAFAFACIFALLMGLGLMELVVQLPPEDLSYRHVWALLPIFYFGGVVLARRRYA
jgi:nitric oxide reductase large subunit